MFSNPWVIGILVVVAAMAALVAVFGEKPKMMPDEHGEKNEPHTSLHKKNSFES